MLPSPFGCWSCSNSGRRRLHTARRCHGSRARAGSSFAARCNDAVSSVHAWMWIARGYTCDQEDLRKFFVFVLYVPAVLASVSCGSWVCVVSCSSLHHEND